MNVDHDANLRLALKTRRAVRDAVISNQEDRMRRRRNLGVAILSFAVLMVVLAPSLWNGLEDVLAGEHIFDLSPLLALFVLTLLPAMLAALIAVWIGQRDVEHDRGGFGIFRTTEK